MSRKHTHAKADGSPLLQQLIQDDDDQSREEKLADDQNSVTGSESAQVSVHSRHHVRDCLTDRDQDTEQLQQTSRENKTKKFNTKIRTSTRKKKLSAKIAEARQGGLRRYQPIAVPRHHWRNHAAGKKPSSTTTTTTKKLDTREASKRDFHKIRTIREDVLRWGIVGIQYRDIPCRWRSFCPSLLRTALQRPTNEKASKYNG